ncbi:MAG: sugar transferase [Clostridia bacterium]|nr:sugar transferase [Clostridia bacterium]
MIQAEEKQNDQYDLKFNSKLELIKNKNFIPTYKYSDETYDQYKNDFVKSTKKRWFFKFVKRSFDFLVSLLALILLSPIFLIFAIAIKIDDPHGPVFFKQKRMGKNGKIFNCYKFRSMKTSAPRDMATSIMENPSSYLTRVGKFMRKLSIDELPQLWCCFIGTMSIIGPRPLVLTEENCNNMRLELGAFRMRPGITGYAQIHGRDDVYYKNKALLDAEYANRASIWFDVKIFFQSIFVVLKRDGNHDDAKKAKKGKKLKKKEHKIKKEEIPLEIIEDANIESPV